MTDYNQTTDFAVKDSLPKGDAQKIVRGAEIHAEFQAIEAMSKTKVDKPTGGAEEVAKVVVGGGGYTYAPGGVPISQVVTLNGTQTLTNKTLTNPTVHGGTLSNVALLNPTMSNVTLTSPTINGGQFNNIDLNSINSIAQAARDKIYNDVVKPKAIEEGSTFSPNPVPVPAGSTLLVFRARVKKTAISPNPSVVLTKNGSTVFSLGSSGMSNDETHDGIRFIKVQTGDNLSVTVTGDGSYGYFFL